MRRVRYKHKFQDARQTADVVNVEKMANDFREIEAIFFYVSG